jgi:nucleoside-diphosphate-sugar epimerase
MCKEMKILVDWKSWPKVYILDITKAKKELGWKATGRSKEGVEKLVELVGENKGRFKVSYSGEDTRTRQRI